MQNMKIPSITDMPQLQPIKVEPKPTQVSPMFRDSVTVTSERLLKALYWIWDAFERANVPYFLTGQTAVDAMANKPLSGEKVTVGIREVEWISGGGRILRTFLGEPHYEDKRYAQYEFEGVPVFIEKYDDHECIIATDTIIYGYETFRVPNPYETFVKLFTQ